MASVNILHKRQLLSPLLWLPLFYISLLPDSFPEGMLQVEIPVVCEWLGGGGGGRRSAGRGYQQQYLLSSQIFILKSFLFENIVNLEIQQYCFYYRTDSAKFKTIAHFQKHNNIGSCK